MSTALMDGDVAILNCTDGDTRISFNSAEPAEVERAKAVVEDMLKRGYCLAVVVGDKMERVVGFDATKSEYVVQDPPVPTEGAGRPSVRRGRPAKSSKAVAVGRTAGGGLGGHAFGVRLCDLKVQKVGQSSMGG